MEKQRGVKALSIVALLIAVVGLTVAFAAMSRTLTINGTATMDTAKWDIKFANLSEVNLGGKATSTMPALADTKVGDYTVTLTRPGDSVEYTFDVVNAGDINATLGTYTKDDPEFAGVATDAEKKAADEALVESKFIYTLTYAENYEDSEGNVIATAGTAVAKDQALKAGTTAKLKLHIEYDSEAEELPSDDVNITGLDITMIYDQAD